MGTMEEERRQSGGQASTSLDDNAAAILTLTTGTVRPFFVQPRLMITLWRYFDLLLRAGLQCFQSGWHPDGSLVPSLPRSFWAICINKLLACDKTQLGLFAGAQ